MPIPSIRPSRTRVYLRVNAPGWSFALPTDDPTADPVVIINEYAASLEARANEYLQRAKRYRDAAEALRSA